MERIEITSLVDIITLVFQQKDLVGVYFEKHKNIPKNFTEASLVSTGTNPHFLKAVKQIKEYLNGERESFTIPLKINGTPFQQKVWAILQEIPYGSTITYGEIAQKLALLDGKQSNSSFARHIGGAVGKNPLSIIIPCHRVVGKDGSLTGYSGGLDRKKFLLQLEGHP